MIRTGPTGWSVFKRLMASWKALCSVIRFAYFTVGLTPRCTCGDQGGVVGTQTPPQTRALAAFKSSFRQIGVGASLPDLDQSIVLLTTDQVTPYNV